MANPDSLENVSEMLAVAWDVAHEAGIDCKAFVDMAKEQSGYNKMPVTILPAVHPLGDWRQIEAQLSDRMRQLVTIPPEVLERGGRAAPSEAEQRAWFMNALQVVTAIKKRDK